MTEAEREQQRASLSREKLEQLHTVVYKNYRPDRFESEAIEAGFQAAYAFGRAEGMAEAKEIALAVSEAYGGLEGLHAAQELEARINKAIRAKGEA